MDVHSEEDNSDDPISYVSSQTLPSVAAGSQMSGFEYCKRKGHLLMCIGRYDEALPHFESAFSQIRTLLRESGVPSSSGQSVYDDLFCSVGRQLASVLECMGQIDRAEEVYLEVLEVNKANMVIGDYATFLHRRHQTFPRHSAILVRFAAFLRYVKRDVSGTLDLYERAIKADPKNPDALGNFASFLHGRGSPDEHSRVESLYDRAIAVDSTHINNLCNYGLFLSEVRHSFPRAKEMYERALVVDPQHANSLYNYGVMLDTHLKQKDEAEELYRRAIAAAPRHAFACYNLAVLLEERLERLDRSQAEQVQRYGKRGDDSDPGSHGFTRQERVREVVGMYHRACELSPGDATSLSDYGRFLASQTPLIEQATQALNAALEADPNCETALYHLGALQLNKLDDAPSAELLVRRLLHTSPSHMAGCQLLARLLVIPCKLTKASKDGLPDEALELYERVLSGLKEKEFGGSSPQPGHSFSKNLSLKETLLEYLGIVTSKGSNHQLLRVVTFLSSAQIDISAVDLEADRLLQGMKSTVLGKRN